MTPRFIVVHSAHSKLDLEEPRDAHAFGPFESWDEAIAFDAEAPDECFKTGIMLVGPDPRDVEAIAPGYDTPRRFDA